MRIVLLIVGLTGCQAVLGFEDPVLTPPSAETPEDLHSVAKTDLGLAVEPPFCLGTLMPICMPEAPTAAVQLELAINTDLSSQCATDTSISNACVVVGTSITASGTIHPAGTRPLVLAAVDSVAIGALEFSNHSPAPCASSAATATVTGGGAGGSLGNPGAPGGAGTTGSGGQVAPAIEAFDDFQLRFGCPGGNGAGNTTTTTAGRGGGAVYIASAGTIAVGGTIDVSGGGGSGGTIGDGGGGGGSGGVIVLDAPTIMLAELVALMAAGGGGGEGGGGSHAGAPGDGPDGGEDAASSGGDGGSGGLVYKYNYFGTLHEGDAAASPGANATNASSGGGGGGGGGGVIELISDVVLTTSEAD